MADGHSQARADYYARIAAKHLSPLWESLHSLVPPKPAPRCIPFSGNTTSCAPTC